MQFRPLGKTGISVSEIALGGHEFQPDGSVKGFAAGRDATGKPDFVDPGFATQDRRALVQGALLAGINYFDATIDPEVAALGKLIPAAPHLLVQCRPQGMCYKYERGNRGLVDIARLRPEVERLLKLLNRPRIDVLNFALESPALEEDPNFLDTLGKNIRTLKDAGLIRFAACDTIDSGERYYERMMHTGHFDLIWIHFGPLWPFPADKLFPLAAKLGLGVVTREAFAKGHLFKVAEQSGLIPAPLASAGGSPLARPHVASAAIRWVLKHKEVSTAVLGMRTAPELQTNLTAASAPFTNEDSALLEKLQSHPAFAAALTENEKRFRA